MKRRTMLKLTGGAGLAGGGIVGGYLVVDNRVSCDASGKGLRWCYGAQGRLDAVTESTVFVRERTAGATRSDSGFFESEPTADGEIVALNAETGDIRWTYGEAVGMDTYTGLVVADGVYVGYCTDEIGNCRDLTALELDGETRWTREISPGWSGPQLSDGVLYVVEFSGLVRAHDAETGETLWEREVGGSWSSLVHVGKSALYVESDTETGDTFFSIDRDGGDLRWTYEPPSDQVMTGSTVVDGIGYVVTFDQVAAVDQGEELWRREFGESHEEAEIEGIASGRLFLCIERNKNESGSRVFQLDAIDLATGKRDWTSGPIEQTDPERTFSVDIHEGVVYLSTGQLRALDAETGDEQWSESLDSGPVQSVSVIEENSAGDHALFVTSAKSLASFTPEGERTWQGSVPEDIEGYLIGDSVFVETDTGIYAVKREDGR